MGQAKRKLSHTGNIPLSKTILNLVLQSPDFTNSVPSKWPTGFHKKKTKNKKKHNPFIREKAQVSCRRANVEDTGRGPDVSKELVVRGGRVQNVYTTRRLQSDCDTLHLNPLGSIRQVAKLIS